jgi:ectoine hydroxylase-related dioxygenase (phytanoyl-CoA dioxygenase family)
VDLTLEAGEVALLHNWLMHRSDVNRSDISRRAFSVCYTDARTKQGDGSTFPVIFGEDALKPDELTPAKA